jgi:ankyrin repeat protein
MRVSLLAAAALPLLAVDFNKDVYPILSTKCFSCHGATVQQSGLRLDKRQNALRGGDYGPVIVQGKSAESKLIKKLINGDGGLLMPPTGKLQDDEIATLKAWIDQGGEYGDVALADEPKPIPVDPATAAFIKAIRSKDDKAVKTALAANSDLLKVTDADGSSPLHHAAAFGTIDTLKLLIAKGADVKAVNRRKAQPLHWTIGDAVRVKMLLDNGVDPNATTGDGRTALYLATLAENNFDVIQLLLSKGANPNKKSVNGNSVLAAAAARGDVRTMRALLAANADVHATAGTGNTALHAAAMSRSLEAVRLLAERGANVNALNKRKLSVLSNAAMYGSEDIVKYLLAKGAKVNGQDERGYSALMYAAYSEATPAAIVKELIARGADLDCTGEGETAQTLAAKRGDTEVARLLKAAPKTTKLPDHGARTPSSAITAALDQLEKQSPTFVKRGGCNSCHNQNLPSAAIALARQRHIAAPKSFVKVSNEMREVSADRVMDFTTNAVNSAGYEMFDLGMNGTPRSEYTDALARYIVLMQTADGYWKTPGNRPPLTYDNYITTAMAIYALKHYGEPGVAEDRLRRAAAWLETAQPATTQERAFHLLGLHWAGASAKAIERAAAALADTQRADGGWPQLPAMETDAYATGQALYALQTAGKMKPSAPVAKKATSYLVKTQAADGTWHVRTRSLPVQPYFESGLPYGEDQWISAAGMSWASMALTYAAR